MTSGASGYSRAHKAAMRDRGRIHVCGALQGCYGTRLTYAVRSRRCISATNSN